MSKFSPQFKLMVLLLVLVATIFTSFLLGRFPLSLSDVISSFGGWFGITLETRTSSSVVIELRLPRIIGAVAITYVIGL
ncbi:MAG: hypothetical protein ACFNLO_12250 [Selenomonas massiliensis]